MYDFLVSLSPLLSAVALLQFALNYRKAKYFKLDNTRIELSSASSDVIRNAVIIAVLNIILGMLLALQHLMKVVYRFRGEYFGFSPNLSLVNEGC